MADTDPKGKRKNYIHLLGSLVNRRHVIYFFALTASTVAFLAAYKTSCPVRDTQCFMLYGKSIPMSLASIAMLVYFARKWMQERLQVRFRASLEIARVLSISLLCVAAGSFAAAVALGFVPIFFPH